MSAPTLVSGRKMSPGTRRSITNELSLVLLSDQSSRIACCASGVSTSAIGATGGFGSVVPEAVTGSESSLRSVVRTR